MLCEGWNLLLYVRNVSPLQVRYNDQVKLESVKTEGQFLHCSTRLYKTVGFMVHPNW